MRCIVSVVACVVDVGADAFFSYDVADADETVVVFAASADVIHVIFDSENVVARAVVTAVYSAVVSIVRFYQLLRSAHDFGKWLPRLPTKRCYRGVEAWNASWAEPLGVYFPDVW